MRRIQANGIPMWVTIFATVVALTGLVFGAVALADPSSLFFTDADEALGQRWAGRQFGLGIVAAAAVTLRSRQLYIVALVAGIAREVGDLVAAVTDDLTTIPAVAFALVALGGLAHIATLERSDGTPTAE